MVMAALGAGRQLSVILTLQDKFSRQMKAASGELTKFKGNATATTAATKKGFDDAERSTSKFLLTLRQNFLAWTAAAGAGLGVWLQLVSIAAEYRRTLTTLDGALVAVGTSWDEQRERIEKTVKALQDATSFPAADQLKALSALVLELGNVDAALALLEPSLGLSARTGMTLVESAKLLADALKGEDGAIAKAAELGLNLDGTTSSAERFSEILEFTEGWAIKNKDAYKDMSNAVTQLQLDLSEKLLPALKPIVDTLSELVAMAGPATAIFGSLAAQLLLPFEVLKRIIDGVQAGIESVKQSARGVGSFFEDMLNGMIAVYNNTVARLPGIDRIEPIGGAPTAPGWPTDTGPAPIGPFPSPWPIDTGPPAIGPFPAPIPPGPPSTDEIQGGNTINITSYGDIDADRRIRSQVESALRAGYPFTNRESQSFDPLR